MKTCILTIIFLCTLHGNAQNIDDWFSVNAIAEWHEREQELLKDIEKNQDKILVATTLMAESTARIMVVEKRLHSAYSEVRSVVENAQLFVRIINRAGDIIQIQKDIFKIAEDHPKAMLLAAHAELEMLKSATDAMVQLLMATKETKFNLLNNKQRLDLMQRVSVTLDEIHTNGLHVLDLVRTNIIGESITLLHNDLIDIDYDIQGILEEAIAEYETVFLKQ